MKRFILLALMCLAAAGCQQMGPTQVGVRFRRLPAQIGPLALGGLASRVIAPGELAVLLPWDSLFSFDTSVQDISWPEEASRQAGGDDSGQSYVNTRALDGNEVALAVTVVYRINPQPAKIIRLVQSVATSDKAVREVVASVARAYIRTYMNELKTSDFLNEESRYAAVDKVRSAMAGRLEAYGIEVSRVILNDFRFERLLPDGSIDAVYQEKITEVQKLRQETERENLRIETVKAKKQQELNGVQAQVNRVLEEAQGYRKQAVLRGNGYYESKSNEAKGILALGRAEVEGLVSQVAALSGPGGRSLLKLEIGRQLLKDNPKFFIINQGQAAQGLNLQRIDANQLLMQLGLADSWPKESRESSAELKAAPAPEKLPPLEELPLQPEKSSKK